ncbi:MAG: hypothetical protein ORO03_01880 [Alphaproteobacteria bacterium]|nr:hypothetical protein [Alphaproteobacteria bacterium]
MFRKSIYRWVYAAALILGVSGCATMFTDSHQMMTVTSNPEGAKCVVMRNSGLVSTVDSTPGSFAVKRGMNDIETTCEATGYNTTKVYRATGFNTMSLWNLLNGFGFIVDFATGSLFEYDSSPIYVGMKAN